MEISKGQKIASYVIQGLVGVMFLMGAVGNLMQSEMAIAQATVLGYQESSIFALGVLLLVATILHVIPKTNVLGSYFPIQNLEKIEPSISLSISMVPVISPK